MWPASSGERVHVVGECTVVVSQWIEVWLSAWCMVMGRCGDGQVHGGGQVYSGVGKCTVHGESGIDFAWWAHGAW